MIAIIGNPNVGKTTFLKKLKDENYTVFETDAWVSEHYKFGNEVFNALKDHFGEEVVLDQKISKEMLKTLIIKDFSVLREIEDIVHPYLYKHLSTKEYDFVEIPIMKWSPIDFTDLFEKVINIVDTPLGNNSINVDNFLKSLTDTNTRAYREIEAVDIYVKTGEKATDILKKSNILIR
ncbi:dephospho-CoA kinase [Mycoplasma marinum]|uniref:Dephospho-CoA kinase n=1 Tax=Mycoplasma marinum TaxID=1937190 RepID=A0A4V2NI25_9MOLU|nr:dephospho-CoA kinase [Mycoplasma marinum]TCG11238.1 hypothetical protein C4B24_02660 [Mycoplasma marinum]